MDTADANGHDGCCDDACDDSQCHAGAEGARDAAANLQIDESEDVDVTEPDHKIMRLESSEYNNIGLALIIYYLINHSN